MTEHKNDAPQNGRGKERILQDIASLRPPSSQGASSSSSSSEALVSGGKLSSLGGNEAMVEPGQAAVTSSPVPSLLAMGGSSGVGQDVSSNASGAQGDDIERIPGAAFPAPAPVLTQEGPHGLRYDFNLGIRVKLPEGEQWRIRFWDGQTDTCLYDQKKGGEMVYSRKKYFLQGVIELFDDEKLVWTHHYNARGKKVAVIMPAGTLGDPLGWIPYVERFGQVHGCTLTVVVSEMIRDLMGPVYPEIRFMVDKEFGAVRDEFYATYYLGLFFHDEDQEWQPRDFRAVGLHRTAGWILGVDPTEVRPRVAVEEPDTRPIEEPYVVVAVQASCACKMWHHPIGWLDTVKYLKKMGYRVICIDKDPVVGVGCYWNALPHGVEDETGERPLAERARWLKHAEFFVGLSSGLSWLAWAVETPVVMISGFTDPMNEFTTPYRVFSTHGCNSCWHDVRTPFQHNDYLFCPRHKGTDRAFECTRIIGTAYVIDTIKRLCRDHGYVPPAVAAGEPWPDDKERAEGATKQEGYEHRHEVYWTL
ncbi:MULTISPECIES: autotransporter strand-loop-strand O-heptosyltransferase [Bombella]|uniref:Autotransporter strand-loop-strand O-heptosyltransferase n=1 Tax=Bombella pollinis TaxID=2967337 RepID=A0ABT3WQD2_9PROT|nr:MULTISPECIES: autotransporter strand-loop-strand O-heptosyltransferase [Bombella]MCX5619031.1 autotransporter strand-loop-strand O-heptosyltransferase [Bombella pollinis]MUG05393.1 autotransporter strand-loop-strand O-heptosyltransferase [Bombella sp. ESL0378]MUG89448.1 autotransporter strand-loop-strand O-heptosyltransferase [Bombella sp. ESL0385]